MAEHHNSNVTQIIEMLRQSPATVLTTHAKPDGDALGSIIALALAMKKDQPEQQVTCVCDGPVPHNLQWLIREAAKHDLTVLDLAEESDHDAIHAVFKAAQCIGVLDTCAWSQLPGVREFIEPNPDKTVVVDHHLHGDEVGAMRWIDGHAAATAEMVMKMIDELAVALDPLMARALYAGLASDTGWFRYSNTTAATHRTAARLMDLNIDAARIYQTMERNEPASKLKLLTHALANMIWVGERAAIMVLHDEDFQQAGATPEQTERLIDVPQMVQSLAVVALVSPGKDGQGTRLSFRSRPDAPEGEQPVDVNELAQKFGGGGHARAAGAKMDTDIDAVVEKLTEALRGIAQTAQQS